MKNSKFKIQNGGWLALCLAVIFNFSFLTFNSPGADIVTATVAVTNLPVDSATITVNGNVRTWKDTVTAPNSQIATALSVTASATNLYLQIAANPYTSLSVGRTTSTNVTLQTQPGVAILVTLSAGWGSVTYATNTLTSARVVRVPMSVEASGPRAEIASQLVSDLNVNSTNKFFENATLVVNLLGNTNTQIVAGIKIFTNVAGQWFGIVSNSPAISGNFVTVSNGIWWNGKLVNPISTNGANYGNAFRSPGSALLSEQFGNGALATGQRSLAVGSDAVATGDSGIAIGHDANSDLPESLALGNGAAATKPSSTAIGSASQATATNSTALGNGAVAAYFNSTAVGFEATTTRANQTVLGSDNVETIVGGGLTVIGPVTNLVHSGTNNFPVQSDIAFGRFPVTSLANGNNAAVPVGTNVFIEVSGPSAAFTINGINAAGAQRDGKLLVILNQTTFNMTIAHESGTDPTAANRIVTMTGTDRPTTGNGTATLMYSGAASRWILIGFDP